MSELKYYVGVKDQYKGKLFKFNDKVASILQDREAIEAYSAQKHGAMDKVIKGIIKGQANNSNTVKDDK